jgi:hypothetical protein
VKAISDHFEVFSLAVVVDADKRTRAALRLAFYAGAHAILSSMFEADDETQSDDADFLEKVSTLIEEVDEFESTLEGGSL